MKSSQSNCYYLSYLGIKCIEGILKLEKNRTKVTKMKYHISYFSSMITIVTVNTEKNTTINDHECKKYNKSETLKNRYE